jgi:guanylate kinase
MRYFHGFLLAMNLGSAQLIYAGWSISSVSAFTNPPRQSSLIRRSMTTTIVPDMTGTSQNSITRNNNNKNLLLDPLVVCGPSGVGKGTIIQKYMDEMGGHRHFGFTVSHTTRPPRPGEVNGIHYHFVPKADMQRQIEDGNYFLEHAHVHGNLYGTSFDALWRVQNVQGKRCLLDIDVQGVQNLKSQQQQLGQWQFRPKYLFIAPPSLQALQERLILRGTESPESIERRTRNAAQEVEYGLTAGNFDKVIINDDLEQACHDFSLAIQELYNF